MSDIFLSYASKDRQWAQLLAECLQEQGWSVWLNFSRWRTKAVERETLDVLELLISANYSKDNGVFKRGQYQEGGQGELGGILGSRSQFGNQKKNIIGSEAGAWERVICGPKI